VECGLQIPADENAKPVYAEYEGELYWVNINRRGEIWINLRDKPQPVFRVVQAKRLEGQEEPAAPEAVGGGLPPDSSDTGATGDQPTHFVPREQRQQNQRPPQEQRAPSGPKTFLDKIRGMMRRNRRGHGMSGSFQYLTKALKTDEAGLLAQLGEHGLTLVEGQPPVETTVGDFVYWLNKNNRGEIWINAELKRKDREQRSEGGGQTTESSAAEAPAPVAGVGDPGQTVENVGGGLPPDQQPAPADPTTAAPAPIQSTLPPENTLTAVRLLMQPKKRGEGVTALVSELAEKLEKTPEVMMAVLAAAGLTPPESPKGKPTFAEHGGELYWLNVSAKGDVWLNAKSSSATKKSKGKKSDDEE